MKTDELVARLSADTARDPWREPARALGIGVAAGTVASFAIMVLWLGIRPDLAAAMSTSAYWMKFAYTAAFAIVSFWLLERLARPGAPATTQEFVLFVPFLALASITMVEMANAAPPMRHHMMMGSSANVCPWRIIALSLPVFVGAFSSLRKLAPTRLILSGAIAGLLAGAVGAWVYAFHCDESAAPFVAIFYTLGVVVVGALGGAIGRFALRW